MWRNHTGLQPVHVQVARSRNHRIYEATLGQEQLQTAGRIDAIAGQLLPIVDGHDHQLYDYTTVSNDSGTLRIDLPSAWADIEADRVRIAGGQREPSLRVTAVAG